MRTVGRRSGRTTFSTPHPVRTFTDKIVLKADPAAMPIAKSYLNCTKTLHCRTSIRGIRALSEARPVRLVQVHGGHELCFSDPKALARAIMLAGRE